MWQTTQQMSWKTEKLCKFLNCSVSNVMFVIVSSKYFLLKSRLMLCVSKHKRKSRVKDFLFSNNIWSAKTRNLLKEFCENKSIL